MAHVFRSCAHLYYAYHICIRLLSLGLWRLGGGLESQEPPSGPSGQDNVLSLRLAAFGGLGVVAGLMVQNSLDACRDPVWLGSPEFVIFTEFP